MANIKTFTTKYQLSNIKKLYPYLYKTIEKAIQHGLQVKYVTVKFGKDDAKILQYKLHTKNEDGIWLTWTNQELLGYMERENAKNNQLQKFSIPVTRIGYAYHTIEVMAKSQEDAVEKALDEAGNIEFTERESEYKVVY